jgi:hypothetical protein
MSAIPPRKRGRPRGAKGKRSKTLQANITKFLAENFEEVKACFYELSPKARANFYLDLLPFAIPKQTSSSIDATITRAVEDESAFLKLTQQLITANNERLKQLQPPSQPLIQQPISIPISHHKERESGDDEDDIEWQKVD